MKKKCILFIKSLIFSVVLLLAGTSYINAKASNDFQSVNPVIEITQDELYVQHYTSDDPSDTKIYDTYDLTKSETGTTTIYKLIIPEFTANKVWTRDGVYMDNVCKSPTDPNAYSPHSATAPDKYIPVSAGEIYFLRTYGVGGVKVSDTEFYYYAPVLFMDNENNVIGDALYSELSKSKNGAFVTVPEGATRMHITMYGNQSFTLQKEMQVTDEEFDAIVIDKTTLVDQINEMYDTYIKDPTLYKKPDKAYITFVNDDTRWQMDLYADLFLEKEIPLCLATCPDALIECDSTQTKTRLDVVKQVVNAGGEVLAHNTTPLTEEGFSDYETMYNFFVRQKIFFNYYGFDVNGIILSGGTGQVTGSEKSERWVSSLFSYSDLYGVPYSNKDICMDSVYHHGRGGFYGFKGDVEAMKAQVDTTIANKGWHVFYFHDSSDVSLENMEILLDYVKSKSDTNELEIVTYKEMYERFAEKESVIKNNTNTYYVSATGTSQTGLSVDDPRSYETAQNKTYISGDTILFKRGDTFYGSFSPKISAVNEKVVTISSYGEGPLPTFSAYKIADSASSWQAHGEGLFKVYLKDINAFSGLKTTDDNSCNIGFLEDQNNTKYYNKSSSLSMANEYDFYCDGSYIYMKCDENPYNRLGALKMATKTNLLVLSSNMRVNNIRVCGTGAHGILGFNTYTDNVVISNCIIEDIGGSYLKDTTRYGNGIEFYNTHASNILVKNNIIRNVYDVAFTIQGTVGSGKNVTVTNNFFANNTQDSEIWENLSAGGVSNYQFTNNISVNQGRGWGYEAREDKYPAAHILFWGYCIEGDTDIYFHHNIVYNPRRLYFMAYQQNTHIYFKEKNYIKSDYNTYLLTEDASIFRDSFNIHTKNDFIAEYNKDTHSIFSLIEVDEGIIKTASTSTDIKAVNGLFKEINEDDYKAQDTTPTLPDDDTPAPETPLPEVPPLDDSDNPISSEEGKNNTANDIHTHTAGAWETTDEPTADVEGMKIKKCIICDTIMEAETIPIYTISFNVTGTLPLQLKKSTTAIKATPMEGDKIVSYHSSNSKVVSVTEKGKITGKKIGTATITVTTEKGAEASIKIKVQKNPVKTTKLTFSKKKITLKKGKTYTIKVNKTPITSLEKTTYKTSNKKVATVTNKGKIKAKKAGNAKITVKCGKKKVTIQVTVK